MKTIIKYITLGVGLSCILANASSTNSLVREDIRTFSQDTNKVAKLRHAVATLKQTPLVQLNSWSNLAAIHMVFATDHVAVSASPQIKDYFNQCHADESLFFLWHRAYVSALEHLMQEAIQDPEFRLPYWDWYADPVLPKVFREIFTDSDRKIPNPLFVPDRLQPVNDGKRIWTPEWTTSFSEASFSRFQDSLNFTEHGQIHMAIGTRQNMGHPRTAARDPIFYLHHANIDRLLVAWRKLNPISHLVPTNFSAWNSPLYKFPAPGGASVKPTVPELALAAEQPLDYSYQSTEISSPTPPPLPPRPPLIASVKSTGLVPLGRGTFSLSSQNKVSIGAAATLDLTLDANAEKHLMVLNAPPRANTSNIVNLVLDRLVLTDNPSPGVLSYGVFVNLPQRDANRSSFEDFYAGTISLFQLGHAVSEGEEHTDHGGHAHRFPITALLKRQMQKRIATSSKVFVSLVPKLAPWAKAPTNTVITADEIRLESIEGPQE